MAPRCSRPIYCTCRSAEHLCNCASHHDINISQHPLILDQSTSPQEDHIQWSVCMSTYGRSHCGSSASDTSVASRLHSSRGNLIAPNIVPTTTHAPAPRGQLHSGNTTSAALKRAALKFVNRGAQCHHKKERVPALNLISIMILVTSSSH